MVGEKYFHVGLVNTSFTNANTIVFVSLVPVFSITKITADMWSIAVCRAV